MIINILDEIFDYNINIDFNVFWERDIVMYVW